MSYSNNYVYRVQVYESLLDNWLEVRHTSCSLSGGYEKQAVQGLAKHKGQTGSKNTFQTVDGTLELVYNKDDLEFFVGRMSGNTAVNNTYSLGGDRFESITIEQYDPVLDKTILYQDVGIKSIQLIISYGNISGMSVQLSGGFSSTLDTRPSENGTITRNDDSLASSVDTFIEVYVNETLTDLCVRSIDMSLMTAMETIKPLGLDYDKPFGSGLVIPVGNITFYSDLNGFNLYKEAFDNEPVKIIARTPTSAFTIYEAYLGGELPTDSGQDTDVDIQLDFESVYSEDNQEIATVEIL